jgi:hypothetical protein
MRALALSAGLLLAAAAHAGPAAERYAPAQLHMASLDARLAWNMTESEQLRAEAAEVGGAAHALVKRLTPRR